MTAPSIAPVESEAAVELRLLRSLAAAASTFAAARNQYDRLWSMHEYLAVVLDILRLFPVTLPMLAPHNALSQALATQASGSPHPLLASVIATNRPTISPARLVDRTVAVLTSEIFHRGGLKRGAADEAAARLVSALGVVGTASSKLTARTVTNWRSDAGKTGNTSEVGLICAYHLKELPVKLTADDAQKIAKAFAVNFLAARYQTQDSVEG